MLEEIEMLRREIDRIDGELIELIRRRLDIAMKIGLLKKAKGAPIRDLTREAEVEERWIRLSREKGIPESLAREIAKILIRYSIAVQTTLTTNSKRVAVLGYGGMARTLGEMMVLAGHRVMIGGRDPEKARDLAGAIGCEYGDPRDIILRSDYVVIALSREAFTNGYVDSLATYMKGKIVMDILSAKTGIYEKMASASKELGFSYISTHPLFGPSILPYGETIVLIPSDTGAEVLEEAMIFWSSIGLVPVIAGYDEHERAMAIVQVIPHLYMLALSEAIEDLSRRYGVEYRMFRTYNMRKIDEVVERIKNNAEVIKEIQRYNKYASEARRVGVEALIKVARIFGGDYP
ncbi:MAG: chorismate mutase [Sulfolobales archaeon]